VRALVLISFCTSVICAADLPLTHLPAGYIIVPSSVSPDKRYGVSAFDNTLNEIPAEIEHNKLINLQTGRIVGEIRASPAMIHMPHGGILPARWSSDGSLLLWEVEGKWSPHALVLLRVKDDTVQKQVDLLTATQRLILARTRGAAPDQYAAATKANRGNGSAYPEGFTIDVEAYDPIALPFHVRAMLTSDPKGLSGIPKLDSFLDAVLSPQWRLKVTGFHLGSAPSRHF
jgi:hypothetical protein